MRFNNFFMEYKLGLEEIRSLIPWDRLPMYRKVLVFALIILSVAYMILSLFQEQLGAIFFSTTSIIYITLFLQLMTFFAYFNSKKDNCKRMLEEHYKPYSRARINMLKDLLKKYGIKLDTDDAVDKLDLLIQQAEEDKIYNNPLFDFKKSIKLLGAGIIPAIIYVADQFAERASMEEIIAVATFYIVVFSMIFAIIFAVQPGIMRIIYPDNDKYEKLIYDLKQLKIFPYIDITTNDNQ
ncbi:MAG: hypothetical protein UH241_00220 [Acutalibacteraceae bacterium]|nr:hypothetical protein [Acutalibacteraceae bacterium]